MNIALGSLIHALEDDNPTFNAVKTYCDQYDKLTCNHIVPFSSARKWSGASFDENGSYIFGATEFILKDSSPYQEIIKEYSEKGQRVLMLAHSQQAPLFPDQILLYVVQQLSVLYHTTAHLQPSWYLL